VKDGFGEIDYSAANMQEWNGLALNGGLILRFFSEGNPVMSVWFLI
jgi:hypothetical protein